MFIITIIIVMNKIVGAHIHKHTSNKTNLPCDSSHIAISSASHYFHQPRSYLHIQRLDDRVQKLLAYFGIFVLEAWCQLVEERLGRQHTAVQQLAEEKLRLFADCVPSVAQPIDDVWQNGRCVDDEILTEPVD